MYNLYRNEEQVKITIKYQEITILSDNSYIRCINGMKYTVYTHKPIAVNSIALLDTDGKFIKCEMQVFSYTDTLLPENKNKRFIRVID